MNLDRANDVYVEKNAQRINIDNHKKFLSNIQVEYFYQIFFPRHSFYLFLFFYFFLEQEMKYVHKELSLLTLFLGAVH